MNNQVNDQNRNRDRDFIWPRAGYRSNWTRMPGRMLAMVLICLIAAFLSGSCSDHYAPNNRMEDTSEVNNSESGQTATTSLVLPISPTPAQTINSLRSLSETPSFTPTSAPILIPTLTPTPKLTPKPTARPTPKPTTKPTPKPTPAPQPDANGIVWYNGYADPRTIKPQTVPAPGAMTVLVNKYWQLPAGYLPPLEKTLFSANQSLHPIASESWVLMHQACLEKTGVSLYLVSGYRSEQVQTTLFNQSLAEKGVAHTVAYYAYPGRSEHQLGLGLDIGTTEKPYRTSAFATSSAGKWMNENAHQFGFILRYPAGKSSITGYAYEAWHFRCIGVEAATAVRQREITFDQYAGG